MVLVRTDGLVPFESELLLFVKLVKFLLLLWGLDFNEFIGSFLFLLDCPDKVFFLVDWLLSDGCALAQDLYFFLFSLKCSFKL